MNEASPAHDSSAASTLVDPRLDAAGNVEADVACVKCTYNLRALAVTADCPECGTPVEDTLRQTNLALADPAWLTHLISGVTWLIVTAIATPAILPVLILGLPLAVIGIVGIWKFTMQPTDVALLHNESQRLRVRWGFVVAVALTCMSAGCATLAKSSPWNYDVSIILDLIAVVIAVVGCVVWAVSFQFLGRYLLRLSLRAGQHRLAAHTRLLNRLEIISIGLGLLACLCIAIAIAVDLGSMGGGGTRWSSLVIAMLAGVLLLLGFAVGGVYWIWGIVLLFQYRKALLQARGDVVLTRRIVTPAN